jgi:hypothetical protein
MGTIHLKDWFRYDGQLVVDYTVGGDVVTFDVTLPGGQG